MTIHVSLSGGLDSTTLLALAVADHPRDVKAWSIDYGQSHRRELYAARDIAAYYQVPHRVLHLDGLLSGSALLSDTPLPEGHYTAETMKDTVVNGRNLLFISALVAQAQEGDEVWVGVHAGDHAIYADCRPEFIWPLAQVTRETYGVYLNAPFVNYDKAHIAATGAALAAPLHLTWSCYAGGERHCGRCGTCVERAEAFHLAGVPDLTTYADPDFWRTQCNVS